MRDIASDLLDLRIQSARFDRMAESLRRDIAEHREKLAALNPKGSE